METIDIEKFMDNPKVKEAVKDTDPKLRQRKNFKPAVCPPLSKHFTVMEKTDHRFTIHPEAAKRLPDIIDQDVKKLVGLDSIDTSLKDNYCTKRKIGVVFSGGPAPGGHNVIAGIFDAAKKANKENRIFGFLMGPDGIIENRHIELTADIIDKYRNLGGFNMIKTGRTKIDTKEKISLAKENCIAMGLDALIVIGGDDSNTNAAFLAQELFDKNIQVIGVPKTIDGDIQVKDKEGNVLCATSFGFHSAARGFSQNIGNLATDGSSDVKYWHICKVMGRVASHLALETALQTHPSVVLIGEDIADYTDNEKIEKAAQKGVIDYEACGMTLDKLAEIICDAIVRRAAIGKNYGMLIIPEGILEFVNEIQTIIIKLNTIIADYNKKNAKDFHKSFPSLEEKIKYLDKNIIWNISDKNMFSNIPAFFQEGLLMERDSHGNFPFSLVPTEQVLVDLIKKRLKFLREKGLYYIGIEKDYFVDTIKKAGLDPKEFGQAIFKNYESDNILIIKEHINSLSALKEELLKAGAVNKDKNLPKAVEKIYKKTVPSFKTTLHFYGYDGRGGDPTAFDCNYAYNLGLTVFGLIAGKATGVMASIKNLEHDLSKWQPIGIPIASLMHLEERKGKLDLVIEKSIVDLNSPAFLTIKALREKWLSASQDGDDFRRPGPILLEGDEDRPISLFLNSLA